MTEDEKHNLLRKDLCARFPYYVKLKVKYQDDPCKLFVMHQWETIYVLLVKGYPIEVKLTDCQPYLRPMSSMTEEEKKDLLNYVVGKGSKYFEVCDDVSITDKSPDVQDAKSFELKWINFNPNTTSRYIDWLNAHHFDYRGLIEKGLAIEAPEGMYIFNK